MKNSGRNSVKAFVAGHRRSRMAQLARVLFHHLAVGEADGHHLMERHADDRVRRCQPRRPDQFDADAMIMMEVNDIRPQPLDQLPEKLNGPPIADREMDEIVRLGEIEILPIIVRRGHDRGAGLAIDRLVLLFERGDQVGVMPLPQARLKQLKRQLLFAAGSDGRMKITDIDDAHGHDVTAIVGAELDAVRNSRRSAR